MSCRTQNSTKEMTIFEKRTVTNITRNIEMYERLCPTNQKLIDVVIANNNKPICKRILATNDKSYIEYLWGEGFKHNMSLSKSGTGYKYWSVQGENLVDEIKNYDFIVLKGEPMNEAYQFTTEDIKLMVEMVLDRIKGEENDMVDITPDMILSDDGTIV